MKIIREIPDLDVATQIAAEGFMRSVSEALRKDVEDHLKDRLVLRALDGEKDVAFAAFNLLNDTNLYLAGMMVRPEYQQKGLFAQLVAEARVQVRVDGNEAHYLSLRTQSCPCFVAFTKLCSRWEPGGHHYEYGYDQILWAKGWTVAEFLGKKRQGEEMDYHRCKEVYGGPMYGKKPVYHDKQKQSWWDSWCDFEKGDAIICIGALK